MQKKGILLVVIVLVVAGGLFFFFQKKQSSPALTNNTEKGTQQSGEKYPQHIEDIPGSDEVWYGIPEYGVRMRLNKEFAEDLIYSNGSVDDASEKQEGIYFSTKAITAVAPECSPERGGAFGFLFKAEGNMTEIAKTDEYLAARVDDYVQIGNYYYGFVGHQAVPWFPEHEEAVRKAWSLENYPSFGAKYVSDGIKTLQLIPSK